MHARAAERGQDEPEFSLIFPTYNAGPALDSTWRAAVDFLHQARDSWEILFVCDGCTDGSPDKLRDSIAAGDRSLRVVSYTPNRGKGFAVRAGLRAARGRWRIFTDVDLAYGFDDVLRVAAALRSGADVAIASRLHSESRLILPPRLQGYAYRRFWQSLAFSAVVRTILPITQRDTQAGLKGMNGAVAERLLPLLRCDGFEFDCELLTACARLGIAVAEVPVYVRYEDAASTTRGMTIVKMLRQLWSIRRAWHSTAAPPIAKAGDRPSDGARQAA